PCPSDIFVRGIAATLGVLVFPFSLRPPGTRPPIRRFYGVQTSLRRALAGLGPLLAAVAIVMVGSWSVTGGIGLLLLTIYYCGYPAVQFHIRHFFHLEFAAWWALLFVLASSCRAGWARLTRRPLVRPLNDRARGALITLAAIVAVVLGP